MEPAVTPSWALYSEQRSGCWPGLGPATTIALLLPVTYTLDPTAAVILLAGVYYGPCMGGRRRRSCLNIPGEASSVVTCLDGYRDGAGGSGGSGPGHLGPRFLHRGTIGIFLMAMVAPTLASFALQFGPAGIFFLGFVAAS